MSSVEYPETMTLRAARSRYFAANRFGSDGGYGDAWVDFKLGPIPFPFPNTRARVRAVRYHDLHHVLTGYAANFAGELEISGWEIAAGCKDFWAAWLLNLSGMACGLLVAPRRTALAFFRGRQTHTIYGEPYEALLDRTIAEVRLSTGLAPGPSARPSRWDWALLVIAWLAGAAVGLAVFAIVLSLVPIGLATMLRRKTVWRQRASS
jgi:hypothetical protein